MKTSIYVPDDLYAELKRRKAPLSQIARKALEDWLIENDNQTDPTAALRLIESGVSTLREQIRTGAMQARPLAPAKKRRNSVHSSLNRTKARKQAS